MRRDQQITHQQKQSSTLTNPRQLQDNSHLQGCGFEIFGAQEFLRYPVIGINQPTSDYKPEGKFHNRVTGEIYDSIEVVWLSLQRSMEFRPRGYSDQIPSCFSLNAQYPDPSVEEPIHNLCHRIGPRGLIPECPNAQWIRGGDGKAKRACDLKYTAAIDLHGDHYLFYTQGRSIAPLERFLSQMRQLRQPLFGLRISLALTYRTKKEGFLGNFYELNFPDLTNQLDRNRFSVVNALDYQETATFFKHYFTSAPSDIYHEEVKKEEAHPTPYSEHEVSQYNDTRALPSPQQWDHDSEF